MKCLPLLSLFIGLLSIGCKGPSPAIAPLVNFGMPTSWDSTFAANHPVSEMDYHFYCAEDVPEADTFWLNSNGSEWIKSGPYTITGSGCRQSLVWTNDSLIWENHCRNSAQFSFIPEHKAISRYIISRNRSLISWRDQSCFWSRIHLKKRESWDAPSYLIRDAIFEMEANVWWFKASYHESSQEICITFEESPFDSDSGSAFIQYQTNQGFWDDYNGLYKFQVFFSDSSTRDINFQWISSDRGFNRNVPFMRIFPGNRAGQLDMGLLGNRFGQALPKKEEED